jgi:hypothetical protein
MFEVNGEYTYNGEHESDISRPVYVKINENGKNAQLIWSTWGGHYGWIIDYNNDPLSSQTSIDNGRYCTTDEKASDGGHRSTHCAGKNYGLHYTGRVPPPGG